MVPLCVDVADVGATKAALESAGPIDLVVNNAGIARLQNFLDATSDDFDAYVCAWWLSLMITFSVQWPSMSKLL